MALVIPVSAARNFEIHPRRHIKLLVNTGSFDQAFDPCTTVYFQYLVGVESMVNSAH